MTDGETPMGRFRKSFLFPCPFWNRLRFQNDSKKLHFHATIQSDNKNPHSFQSIPNYNFFQYLTGVIHVFFCNMPLDILQTRNHKKTKKSRLFVFFNTWILAGTGRLHDFRTFARFHPDGRWLMAMPASPPPILPSCSKSQSKWPTEGTIPPLFLSTCW